MPHELQEILNHRLIGISSILGLDVAGDVVVEVGGSAGWHNAAQKYKVISKNLVATNFILSTTKFILEK